MGLNFFSTNNLVSDKGNPIDAKVEEAAASREPKGEAVASSCNALVTQKMQYHRLAQGVEKSIKRTI